MSLVYVFWMKLRVMVLCLDADNMDFVGYLCPYMTLG